MTKRHQAKYKLDRRMGENIWGRPKSPVWNWLTTYFMGVMDRYAEFPPFDRAQAAHLRRYWLTASGSATSRLIAPALLDVVGQKE